MIGLVLCGLWLVAYIGLTRYFIANRRLLVGGMTLFVISLAPTIYGRSTTPEEWHDYPLMSLYYLPTILAALLALIIFVVGFFRQARKMLRSQTGTR